MSESDSHDAPSSLSVPCLRIREPGAPHVLTPSHVVLPPPPFGHVRVRIAASGVNRADLLQRQGRYPVPAGFPKDIPGLEFAGEVEAVGEGCLLRRVGDPVMGILGGGGYAAAVNVPERETIQIPGEMDPTTAGAIPEVFLTAWDALEGQAGLRAGETVLIHAVGSGVGTAALQLAAGTGARVLGSSRTAEKVDAARELGLHDGILASADDPEGWVDEVLSRTGGRGVDVILDLVGGAYLEGNLRVLATGARWVVVGVPGGGRGTLDLPRLMTRRAHLMGTVLRARPPEEKALLARAFETRVIPRFETRVAQELEAGAGRLRPVVDTILPWREGAEAHRRLEANATFGKVLLRWA
jgi:NADPH:quinone reductase